MSKEVIPPIEVQIGVLKAVAKGHERIVNALTRVGLNRAELAELRLNADAYRLVVEQFVTRELAEISRQNLTATANANRDEARKRIITRAEIEAARVAS